MFAVYEFRNNFLPSFDVHLERISSNTNFHENFIPLRSIHSFPTSWNQNYNV